MSASERQQKAGVLPNIEHAAQAFSQNFGHACQQAAQHLQKGAESVGETLSQVAQVPGRALQTHSQGLRLQPLFPGVASLSLRANPAHSRSPAPAAEGGSQAALTPAQRPQPVFDVAYNPEDIKARLSGVPVYAVINKKEEFVLIAGEAEENQHRTMGLFFFNEQDAQALVDKVQVNNPKMAKESKVLQVGMDAVYHFATAPRSETGTEGVIFRFMPDAEQVAAAVKLYQEAGVAAEGFTGVPVFQAEGLTVKTGQARYTPLFLSKADLDVALTNADGQRQAVEQAGDAAKAVRAQQELEAARLELEKASDKDKASVKKDVDAAAARVDKYTARLAGPQEAGSSGSSKGDDATSSSRPRVEVGCLEEVLVRMEHDEKGEWGEVMFVPSGALTQPQVDPTAVSAGDKGKKKRRK